MLAIKPTPREITRGVIRGVATKHQVHVNDILEPGTNPRKLEARREAVRCVKTCRPHLTNEQIAQLFRVDEAVIRKILA